MITRVVRHMRANAIAYVALFFSLGGGGVGAALAATHTTTIHGCVNRHTGELFIRKHCTGNSRPISFNARGRMGKAGPAGAAGAPAAVAWGQVGDNGVVGDASGLTIAPVSTGIYDVTVTSSLCAGKSNIVPVVTPYGGPVAAGPESGTPVAWAGASETPGVSFVVQAGDIQNGSYAPTNEGFDVQVQCG